jgi:pimeloyl-ACP methyl ester carboxylesterase
MTPQRGPSPADGGARRADFTEAFHPIEDGLALAYRDYRQAAGATAKLPVVCLHALSRNLLDYEEVAPAIAESGRRVVVPSLRGRGRSSWDPKPDRYHPGSYAADVTSLLDGLAIPRAVFVGTSLGGIVTMVLAATQAGRVAAAVLNDVGGDLAPAGLERIKRYVGRGTPAKTWAEAAAKARAVNTIAFPKETGEAFWLTFARRTRVETEAGIVLDYDPAIGETMRAAPPAEPGALWPLFEALKPVPTLVVRGALSDLLARETLAEMRARKPDLAVVEIPDVGHAPLLTEPPAMAALMSFLARVD